MLDDLFGMMSRLPPGGCGKLVLPLPNLCFLSTRVGAMTAIRR